MAKGFTVKATAPRPKKTEEWDIAAIKERMKGKTIVFCLPGRGCSFIFLKNFVQLCFDMVQNGMSIQISQDYSSMVNFARCKCLGANVLRGPNQIPWDGKLEYDYQLWIDSDIVFDTNKFWQLCDMAIAEDGIRDRSPSRGLGDVYKRQVLYHPLQLPYHTIAKTYWCQIQCHYQSTIDNHIAIYHPMESGWVLAVHLHLDTYICLLYTSDAADE